MARTTLFSGTAFCVLSLACAAGAQTRTGAERGETSAVIEEIVVTAERREQSLQALPITASALGGAQLEKQQLTAIDDLTRSVPSLAINDTGTGKFVNIRGIGKSADVAGVPAGVAYYVDGVPIPNQIFLDNPFYDLSRVEVLRGPQGTLVGMNSTGGAVLLVSQNPKYGVVEGSVEQTIGNYANYRTRGVLNLGLGERAALRVAGEIETRDGFFTNLGPAKGDPGSVDRRSVRAALALQPSDKLEIFLRGEYNRNDAGGSAGKPIPGDPDPLYTLLNSISPTDDFTLGRDVVDSRQARYGKASAELRLDLGAFAQLRSITGYQKGTIHLAQDLDATALPTIRQTIDISEPVYSQELNLISTPGQPVDWVVGYFWLKQNTSGEIHLHDALTGAPSVDVTALARTRNRGVFGQATWHASQTLNLTLGLRHNYEKHFDAPGHQTLINGAIVIPGPTTVSEDKAVTGKFTADWQIAPTQFAYATVSRGFKGGGLNDSGSTFGPEKVTNLEIGVKSTLFDRHVKTQLGVFWNRYDAIQVEIYDPITTLTAVQNFGRSKIFGLEFQGEARVGATSFDASAAYTHSKMDAGALVDPRYGSNTPVEIGGRPLNYSPRWTLNVGAEHRFGLEGGFGLTPRVQASYQSAQWAAFFHVRPTDFIPSRTLLDATLRLDRDGSGLRLEAYASNLLDETYIVSKAVTAAGRPGRIQNLGAPRQYGLRVGYAF